MAETRPRLGGVPQEHDRVRQRRGARCLLYLEINRSARSEPCLAGILDQLLEQRHALGEPFELGGRHLVVGRIARIDIGLAEQLEAAWAKRVSRGQTAMSSWTSGSAWLRRKFSLCDLGLYSVRVNRTEW